MQLLMICRKRLPKWQYLPTEIRPRIEVGTSNFRLRDNSKQCQKFSRLQWEAKSNSNKQEFSFDKVFPPTTTQQQVFEKLVPTGPVDGGRIQCLHVTARLALVKHTLCKVYQALNTDGIVPRAVCTVICVYIHIYYLLLIVI